MTAAALNVYALRAKWRPPPVDGPMLYRDSGPRTLRAMSLALVVTCASGCSSSTSLSVMMFADPGKYQYHTCDQITAAGKAAVGREEHLRMLIAKAEQGAGGALVGAIAYRGEHRTVVEELAVIEAAARAKNCLTPSSWRSTTAIQ
jgi:hypothetical protein